MSESNFAKKILPEWQKLHPNARIMRNNTGMAWQGKLLTFSVNGIVQKILKKLRPIFFGVGLSKKDKKTGQIKQAGGGDYIGWESFELCEYITKLMLYNFCEYYKNKNNEKINCMLCPLHQKIAVFLSLETKSKEGKESPDQVRFRETVQEAGGIAIVLKEGE